VLQPKALVKEMLGFLSEPVHLSDFFTFLRMQHADENLEFYLLVSIPF